MLSHNNSRKDTFQSRNPYSAKLSINTECRMTFVDIQILTNVSPFHDIQKAPRCVLQKKGLQTKKKRENIKSLWEEATQKRDKGNSQNDEEEKFQNCN